MRSTPGSRFRLSLWSAAGALALCAQLGGAQGVLPGALSGTLAGTVKTDAGAVVVGAQVVVEGFEGRTVTREDGTFSLAGVPAGTVRATARRLGYRPGRREVVVPAGGTARVDFVLIRNPTEMTPIAVTARKEPYDARLSGFRDRVEKRASGYLFTREQIERSANRSTMDLVRGIPGVRIMTNPRGTGQARSVRFRSNRCPPLVFIDGMAASTGEFDLETLDLNMVEGVEVYLSSTSMPPEFFAVSRGQEQCGVIAVWSRPTQLRTPRPRRPADAEEAESRRAALPADSVDEAAFTLGGDPEIVYPDSLWRESAAGEVTLEFVVDDRGRLDWSSLKVVNETHPYFTRAVLEALASARWEAARLGGRRVAQLVRYPVRFAR
jgi:TonB family protein